MQVDDVGGAAAVDVSQADALVVELVRVVEPGRVVHRHLGAEAGIAEVGPVADFAVADADDVGQAVARQVGQVDGLRAVGKDNAGAFLLVQRLHDASGGAEPFFSERGVPHQGVVFGDQHVGMAVAVEINELEVGVAEVAVQARVEGAERLPAFGIVVFVQARRGTVHDHDVGLTVAGKVHELGATAERNVGLQCNRFERGEIGPYDLSAFSALNGNRAQVALVEPGAHLFGKDARNTFAVQVSPAVGATVQADGKVLQTLRFDLLDVFLHDGLDVFEFHRR